jgi:hypothetical protein
MSAHRTALSWAVVGDSVMYPRTGPETDTIVRANGSGFETFTVVKSSAVPAVSQWSVGLPPGYHLAIEETGTVVVVGADHMVIAEARLTRRVRETPAVGRCP